MPDSQQPVVDSVVSLALSLHNAPGTYAALLGSGVSSEAGVPTGSDLTRQLALLVARRRTGEVPSDIDAWWLETFGTSLDYSTLIEGAAPTVTDQRALLRSVIEATPGEAAAGLKVPTAAHRALAELVVSGAVRVVLTTNFDRLIEGALRSAGVEEQMLSSAGDLDTMVPLQHVACTVVKLHGDYQRTNLRNTKATLEHYEPDWLAFLERILSEYGIFTVGWSGASDVELRQALERRAGRRYGCYIGVHREPAPELAPLLGLPGVRTVEVRRATEFFDSLAATLVEVSLRPETPLATSALVGTTKRLLGLGRAKIDLRGVLLHEAKLLHGDIQNVARSWMGTQITPNSYRSHIEAMGSRAQPLVGALAAGCFYGEEAQRELWLSVFSVVANQPPGLSGTAWTWALALQRFPATMGMYAGALAAAAAEDSELALKLLRHPVRTSFRDGTQKWEAPAVGAYVALAPPEVIEGPLLGSGAPGGPIEASNQVFTAIAPILEDQYPVESRLAGAFMDLEYLMALLQHDWHFQTGISGHARWRNDTYHAGLFSARGGFVAAPPPEIRERFDARTGLLGAGGILGAGLFGGAQERLEAAHRAVAQMS